MPSPGLLGNPIFEATAKIGEATDLVYPAPGYDWDLSGAAGERLPIPFEAMVVEIVNGDTLPVFGEPVTFAILAGETDARVADAQPVKSDAYGIARSHVIADTRSGRTAVVSAEHSDIFYKKWYSVTSFAGPARKMMAVSQTQWTPSPGEEIMLEVRVTDKHSNPSSNVTVEFEVMEGDATLLSNATPKTDITGKASVTVKTGSSAGLVKIWAMGITLEGSPVEFVLNVNTNVWDANSITVYPLSAKQMIVGAVNQFLPDSLRAMVTDSFGNGVSGQYVIFTKIAGDGWLENEYGSMVSSVRVANDEMGVASVRFKCGSIPEVVTRVLAEWSSAKKDTFKIRAVNNPNFPKLDKTIIFNQYPDQIVEGQYPPFKILLRATDLDLGLGYGDKLTFQIGNLFPSEGMEILPQSDTSAYFQWTPNYDQSGWHTVTLKVVDGRGGWDQKTTNLYVQDKNRLPLIMRTIPAEDTSFTAGQTLTFWVDARDQDGDPLSFAWRVNDQVVAGTQPVFFYQVPKTATPGSYTVDVFVSDPVNTISHRWVLSVSSSVTLAEFIAEFLTERSSVRIVWKTSHEVDNFGFDVYRSLSKDGEYIKLNDEIIPGSKDGSYLFVDQDVEVGRTYYYKLINTDARGNQNESSVIAVKVPVPSKFELSQNYPNPFNPVTTIRFQLPKRERVVLTIYNMLGQKIATLIDGQKDPGYYTVEWDGKDSSGIEAATGLYIYRLQSQERSITKRMIKLK